jgi:orotate phosphoribosyltransferase
MSYVLGLTYPGQLLEVRREHFPRGVVSPEEFDHMLALLKALWLHNGDTTLPHAELTSGKCSNGYVNTPLLLEYTNIAMILAENMARIFRETGTDQPDWVIGSDHAAATFSAFVAYQLGAKHEFTVKTGPKGEFQRWERKTILPGEVVLQVEELAATTATFQRVRDGIVAGNKYSASFSDVSAVLVHRAPSFEHAGKPIIYFRHYDIESWDPEGCPLCAVGSKRVRPKENWTELTTD